MKNTIKIHFFYIVSILLSIIIILLSVKWSQIQNLVEYLTFALTLTSIFLALLAIIYSYIQNSALFNNLASMNEVSNTIKDQAKIISITTDELNQQMIKIPHLLYSIEGKADTTITHLVEMKNNSLVMGNGNSVIMKEYSSEVIKNMMRNLSVNAIKLLLVAKYSLIHQKKFGLRKIIADLDLGTWSYAYGFFMPLKGLGIINYQEIKAEKEYEWLVIELNDYLTKNIEEYIFELVEERKEDSLFSEITCDIKSIEAYVQNLG